MPKTLLILLTIAFTAGCDQSPRRRSASSPDKTTEIVEIVDAAPGDPAAEGVAQDDIVSIDEPSRQQVVVVAARIFPSRASPGDEVTMAVHFRTEVGWHFFALGEKDSSGPITPTSLDLELPPGLSPLGDWQSPATENYVGPSGPGRVYGGDVTFRRRLKIDDHQSPGTLTLPCRVRYQCCNDTLCIRPKPETLRPTLEVIER